MSKSITNIKTVLNHPTKGQDIRRFQLAGLEKPFDQLLSFLTQVYTIHPEKLSLRYRDDDGDDCSISSNLELLEAFRIAQQEGRNVLKVDISLDEESEVKEETSTPGNLEILRSSSQTSDEGFVKVEVEKKQVTEEPSQKSLHDAEKKQSAPEPEPSQQHDVEKKKSAEPEPLQEDLSIEPAREAETLSVTLLPLQPLLPVEVAGPSQVEPVPVEQTAKAAPNSDEKEAFPSRAEFFSLLADFLHDSKSMEMVQLLLPGLLKLLDDDARPPVDEILKNIFDFAPNLKSSLLCARLLPFTKQLSDPKMQPLVKDALHKLHDVAKLTSLFRSSKGSIPYMPDFVRLYNHMKKLSQRSEDKGSEKEETQIPEFKKSFPALHRGIKCDECQMFPIQGNRYKCFTCPDYDLCEMCEEGAKHPMDHPMLKIRSPILCRSRSNRKQGPRALFVKDVTLQDGVSCYPGIIVTKTWALKNHGETRWPSGVKLLFLSGDLSPERLNDVPRAEPGEVVEVSAVIKLPMSPKQYTGYYRLATADGKKFGPRIWVDLIVLSGGTEQKKDSIPEPSKEEVVNAPTSPPIQISIEPEGTTTLDIPKLEDVRPDSKEPLPSGKEVVQLPEAVIDKKAPTIEKEEEVQIPEPQKEIKGLDSQQPTPVSDTAPVTSDPKPVTSDLRPVASDPKPVPSTSPYATQLQILQGMGFPDAELNAYLLANNEGNVQRVVEWILSHGVN